jgi:prepilin-type N-terminal cleavage/methylation domain-containing protein
MSTGQANNSRTAFTLIEIMLAVAILGIMAMAIYRFVQSSLIALRVSSEVTASDAAYDGLRDLLSEQWQRLPTGAGALPGDAVKINDLSRDEVTWTCSAGSGLLTRYANSDYVVSMRLRAEPKNSKRLDLGFIRRPALDQAATDVHESWIPLLQNVESLEIRYFDPRLNVWQDRWTDNVALPRLVRVSVMPHGSSIPWQAIIALGRTSL